MKPKVGQCFYERRFKTFRIYRYDHVTEHGGSASPLPDEPAYDDREEARKRVYQLNGWKYTEKKEDNATTATT